MKAEWAQPIDFGDDEVVFPPVIGEAELADKEAAQIPKRKEFDILDAEKDIVDDAQATKDFKSEKPDSGTSDAIGGVYPSYLETAKSIAPENEAKSGSMEKSMPPPIPDPAPTAGAGLSGCLDTLGGAPAAPPPAPVAAAPAAVR